MAATVCNPTIPSYARPVPVGADGIPFRRIHGPRTQAATERLTRYRQAAAVEMAHREAMYSISKPSSADYLAVAP